MTTTATSPAPRSGVSPRPPLFPHQKRALNWLHEHPRGALWLDMGAGKTRTVLEALTPDHLPALVVAPKRVVQLVWPAEAKRWRPDLRVATAQGTPTARTRALRSGADIVAISRDNLADAQGGPWKTIVFDELSSYKNRATKRWKAARDLSWKGSAEYVWGLTGTPAPNGLLDLWPQIYLLDKGERLGSGITKYRERYFRAGRQLSTGVVTEWLLRPGADRRIHELLEDIALSMDAEDLALSLPPVSDNDIEVPLPPQVKRVYKQMKDTLVADLDMLGDPGMITAANAAVLTAKLSQISAGLLFPDQASITGEPPKILHWEKTRTAAEVVEETGSPVLIFYRFNAEKEMLLKEIPGAVTLDEPGFQERWDAGELRAVVAHPASAGHGLNLQHGGHTIVWTTHPYSLEEYQQANKRVSRPGQKHPVMIHHLWSPGTVDRSIMRVLEGKAAVQDALLDHLRSPR